MKSFITFLILTISSYLYATNEITYITKHQPNTTINVTTTSTSDSFVDIIKADPKYLEALKKKGQRFPIMLKQVENTKEVITTQSVALDNTLPFTSEYISHATHIIKNGQKTKIDSSKDNLVGAKFHFSQLENGEIKLNKISSDKLSHEDKQLMFQVISSFPKENAMANKSFKIGDSYTDKTPITMPLGMINLSLIQSTKYTLKAIKKNLAFFDVTATFEADFNMKEKMEEFNMNFNGFGEGEVVYDIAQQIESKNDFLMNFEADLTMKNLMTMKMKSVMNMSIKQEKN